MSAPRNSEQLVNGKLAEALRRRNPEWTEDTLHAERTGTIYDRKSGAGAGKKPDILVAPRSVSR